MEEQVQRLRKRLDSLVRLLEEERNEKKRIHLEICERDKKIQRLNVELIEYKAKFDDMAQ